MPDTERTPYVVCYSLTDDMWVVYYRRHKEGVQPLDRIATGYTKASAWANAQQAMKHSRLADVYH